MMSKKSVRGRPGKKPELPLPCREMPRPERTRKEHVLQGPKIYQQFCKIN